MNKPKSYKPLCLVKFYLGRLRLLQPKRLFLYCVGKLVKEGSWKEFQRLLYFNSNRPSILKLPTLIIDHFIFLDSALNYGILVQSPQQIT